MKQKFAVIGHPIGHTMSPFIHIKLFELQQKCVEYSVFDIHPDCLSEKFYVNLKSLDGFNITIPHKETILSLIDEVDESALKYNAVNCVLNKNGKTYGCSTDAFGFTKALETAGVLLTGKVLVLGAGGAARTLAREASDRGCEVTVAVRDGGTSKAKILTDWLNAHNGKASFTTINKVNGKFDLVINATPIGMYPNTDACPLTEEQLINCSAVFDAVYNPEETNLLKMAENLGLKTVGGMSMLVWQAVKAHEFWYGAEFNVKDIEKLIADANQEMTRIFYEK